MIERLQWQGRRFVRTREVHARVSDAAAHLHQAVEAAAVLPRAAPAIGIEAHVDQARDSLLAFGGTIAQTLQGIGAVTVEHDVGVLEQAFEYQSIGFIVQIQACATFAQCHFRHYARLVPGGWVDAQDISAQAGEKAAGDGASEHAGQVQYLDSGQWLRHRPLPGCAVPVVASAELNQRFGVDREPLRMDLPLFPAAHFGGTATGLDHGLFQITLGPLRHFAGHRLAVDAGAQHRFGGGAVMGRIGVQADPAIFGGVVTGDRVPQRWYVPA
ncbi:hypothetical protein D9M71_490080 [compost metagenome]